MYLKDPRPEELYLHTSRCLNYERGNFSTDFCWFLFILEEDFCIFLPNDSIEGNLVHIKTPWYGKENRHDHKLPYII